MEMADGNSVTGRVVGSDDASVTLDVNGETRTIAYADIAKAVVQVEFDRKKDN